MSYPGDIGPDTYAWPFVQRPTTDLERQCWDVFHAQGVEIMRQMWIEVVGRPMLDRVARQIGKSASHNEMALHAPNFRPMDPR